MIFDVYDTDSPAGEVWLLTFISRVEVRYMIEDSSKPNKFRKYIHHTKHGWERHHPKTENLLYQNQSHLVYHKSKTKKIHKFTIERCKFKKGASVSVVLALFNYSSGG